VKAMIRRGDQLAWIKPLRFGNRRPCGHAAPRPSLRPPRARAPPIALSVTEIKRLIPRPLCVYAKHKPSKLARWKPAGAVARRPCSRGIIVHEIMDVFINR